MASGTETGITIGAVLGGLLFVVFPLAGIAAGAVAGGLIGRAAAPGIDGKWVKEVESDLPPGGSALFLQLREADRGLVIGALRQHKGRVFQTTLADEEVESLK
jgi:uncharacterized membrane protein